MPELRPDAFSCIDWTHEPDDDEATLFGVIDFLGAHHHVMAIQVRENEGGVQEAVRDPYGRLDDAYALDSDICFQPVAIPGREGDWVIVVYPFGT